MFACAPSSTANETASYTVILPDSVSTDDFAMLLEEARFALQDHSFGTYAFRNTDSVLFMNVSEEGSCKLKYLRERLDRPNVDARYVLEIDVEVNQSKGHESIERVLRKHQIPFFSVDGDDVLAAC